MLIYGESHLQAVLRTYADHYNGHRPHTALGYRCPEQVHACAHSGRTGLGCVMTIAFATDASFGTREPARGMTHPNPVLVDSSCEQ